MERGLAHQLRVERGREQAALPQDDGPVLVRGEHVDIGAHVLDPRSADEHTAHRVVDPVDVHVGLERIHLSAVGVATDGDVHQRKQRLAVEHALAITIIPAHAEDGHAVLRAFPQRIHQLARMRQLRDRRRLTARDHEAIDVRELRHLPDLDRDGARGREDADVLAEITLQGEDADLQGTAPYQPRS